MFWGVYGPCVFTATLRTTEAVLGVKTGTVLGCAQFWGVLSFGVLCLLLTPLCHTFCFKSGSRKSVRIKPLGVLMEHISIADRKGSLMSQGQSSICKTPHS